MKTGLKGACAARNSSECPARFESGRATVMGLEADVVLLLDVDGSRWSLEPRNLYVAASRARLRLHVFAKNGAELPGAPPRHP